MLLPRNIKFIVSATENTTAISNVQNKLQDTAVFVQVNELIPNCANSLHDLEILWYGSLPLQIPELRDSESETVLYTLIAESDDLPSSQLPEKIRTAVKDSSLPFYIKVTI